MYNWSINEEKLKKNYPLEYQKWRLLQMINYGLDGERINLNILKKLWPEISSEILDPNIKNYFKKIILEA